MRTHKKVAAKRRVYSALLSFVSCDGVFRWWRPALDLFRHRFLRRDWGGRCTTFPRRSAFSNSCSLAGGRRLAAGRRLALGRRFPVVRRFEVARRFVADTVKCLPITRLSLLAARSPLFAGNNGDQLDSAGQAFLNITSFTDFALAGNRGKDSNRALQLGQCQRWRMTLSSKSSVLRGAIISCSHRTQRIPNMNIERRLFIV
jgi:hypothetical protein